MGHRGMHAKIQRHPSRNDEMVTLLVGRRHLAPGPTKAGPGGTSSRYRKRCERDNLTLPPWLDGSKRDARENSAPSESKRRNGHPAGGSSTSRTWTDEGRTRRDLESVSKAMRTGQLDHATFVGWVREGRTRKFSAIRVETTKWTPC